MHKIIEKIKPWSEKKLKTMIRYAGIRGVIREKQKEGTSELLLKKSPFFKLSLLLAELSHNLD